MLVFKCPECQDDSLLRADESQGVAVCESCDFSLSLQEAEELFEEGGLVAILESDDDDKDDKKEFPFKKKGDKDSDSDDDDDEEDDDKDDKKEESFRGFANRDTWAANLFVQNEYAIFKNVATLVAETAEDEVEVKVQSFVEKKIDENLDINVDNVYWAEIVEAVQETQTEMEAVSEEIRNALNMDESVSAEEKDNLVKVFEAAMAMRYNTLKSNLEEKFSVDLEEAAQANYNSLLKDMSGYLDEVVAEWMAENEIAIESGIKVEMTESFLDGLRDLFAEHYIDVPEERYDVLEDMSDKIEAMDARLAEAAEEAEALQEVIFQMEKDKIVKNLSEGLADTQAEKLVALAESLGDESAEEFEVSLMKLKESFFNTGVPAQKGDKILISESAPSKRSSNYDDNSITRAARGLTPRN